MPISTGNVNQNLQLLMKPHKHKLTQIPNTPKGTFFPQTPTKKKSVLSSNSHTRQNFAF
jgi:hypothetical protein